MPSTEVVIPWRAGCPHRSSALRWVLDRYAVEHPDWHVTLAEAPDGPWIKARAVMPAIDASVADVVVVADADCWTDGLSEAVVQVENGAVWAIPHANVYRLDETGTAALLHDVASATLFGGNSWDTQPLTQRPYRGIPGGGFIVAAASVARAIPLDSRYVGWGQEDESWAAALATLTGDGWRGTAPLLHLWHPPQQRLTRARGSVESWTLRRRYMRAIGDANAMAALIQEAHEHLAVDEPALHGAAAVDRRH